MLLRMKRTQTIEIGTMRAGVTYEVDQAKHAKIIARLLDKDFAEKVTTKQLEKEKALAETAAIVSKADPATAAVTASAAPQEPIVTGSIDKDPE